MITCGSSGDSKMKTQLFFAFFILIETVNCANILYLNGVPSLSHFIWHRPLINKLASRGHNVTILSVDVDSNAPSNVTYIQLENVYNTLYDNPAESNDITKRSLQVGVSALLSVYKFYSLGCKGAITSQGMQILSNYPDDFKVDLIIYDFTCGPCLLLFLTKFKYPPMISLTAFNNPPYSTDIIGGHKFPSYVPHFTLHYDPNMNFMQRSVNHFIYLFESCYRNLIFNPRIDTMVREVYGEQVNFPYLPELEKMSRLMMVNTHPAIDSLESLPPNVIEVGGLQIPEPKQLPESLRYFIEAGRKGAVLFSLGTNIKSNVITPDKQDMFMEAFRRIPDYNFLWKFNASEMPSKSVLSNVMIQSWLPQADILAHPKVSAFITHSGLLSTHEAIWFGVPMIALPIYTDQHINAIRSARSGVAVKLDLHNLSIEEIYNKISEILVNPRYMQNMKAKSSLFRDQPEKPLDRAVWWTEWTLRNRNATVYTSPVITMGAFQSQGYDVGLFVFICMLSIIRIIQLLHRKWIDRIKKTPDNSSNEIEGKKSK